MTRNHKIIITCPACSNKVPFTVWDSVNVSVDKHLKAFLLDGILILFRCDRCGLEEPVAHDCLYHDPDNRLAIWLKYPDDNGMAQIDPAAMKALKASTDNYTCRRVASYRELINKIYVFDDGFTDSYIELAKLIICIREGLDITCPTHYLYAELDKEIVFDLVTNTGLVERQFQLDRYRNTIQELMPRIESAIDDDTDEWPRVNRSHMLQLIERAGLAKIL